MCVARERWNAAKPIRRNRSNAACPPGTSATRAPSGAEQSYSVAPGDGFLAGFHHTASVRRSNLDAGAREDYAADAVSYWGRYVARPSKQHPVGPVEFGLKIGPVPGIVLQRF